MSADRTTSHAKEVTFNTYKENSLDRTDAIKDTFNYSADEAAIDAYLDSKSGDLNEMIKEDAPSHDLRPPPEIAKAQDKQTFDNKWSNEQAKADENQRENLYEELLKEELNEYAYNNRDNDLHRDIDRGI